MSYIQKISTGISGLDKMLLGGLQLPISDSENTNKQNGILITIKGCKGTDKTMFAMQIMHGITKSLRQDNNTLIPAFYSLNKSTYELNDLLLDYIISQCTRKMIMIRQDAREKNQYDDNLFTNFIFKTNEEIFKQQQNDNILQLPDDFSEHIDKYISDGIVFYNIRTNSLHFRTKESIDSQANILYTRKKDDINEYSADVNELQGMYSRLDDIKNDFFTVDFSYSATDQNDNNDDYHYTQTPVHKFQQIVAKIQDEYKPNKNRKPCIVIDGISQIRKQELEGFEISVIERVLRTASLVSIIVIDDVEEDLFPSDLSIEMRRVENDKVNYTIHQLRINKCVFQMTAYGWHQYKKRDYGIEIYPSSHLLLQQKRYLPQSIINTKNGILDHNYLQYLDFSKIYDIKKQFVEYEKDRHTEEYGRLIELYLNRYDKRLSTPDDILGYLLAQKETAPSGKIIAIIGNSNTFKRFLAIGSSFCAAKKGYHTLFLTFDRLSSNLLQQMQCPALINKENGLPCVETAPQ